eukprot:gene6217-7427_t
MEVGGIIITSATENKPVSENSDDPGSTSNAMKGTVTNIKAGIEAGLNVFQQLLTQSSCTCGIISREILDYQSVEGSLEFESMRNWLHSELCAHGEQASCELHFWEGIESLPGESVQAQFIRQVADDLRDLKQSLPGSIEEDERSIASFQSFVQTLMKVYDYESLQSVSGGEPRVLYLKIQINQNGACTKFHDDFVSVRLVTSLVGDPTVIATPKHVDWAYWDSTGGALPESMRSESPEAARAAICTFNNRVCDSSFEVHPETGDILFLKGGALTKRPCIHRAPYSADRDGADPPQRFLVTLDFITLEQRDDLMSMVLDASDDSSVESDDDELNGNAEMNDSESDS